MVSTDPLTELLLSRETIEQAAEMAIIGTGNPGADGDSWPGVSAYVRRIGARYSDRPAVIDGEHVLSYAELVAETDRLCHKLEAAGCRSQDVIATTCPRSARTIAVFLALESIGAVYLPVDPNWTAEPLTFALATSGARLLFDHCGCGRGYQEATALGISVVGESSAIAKAHSPCVAFRSHDKSRQARYCVFTSGSSGRPKGAIVEHRGMMNHLWAMVNILGLTERDRVAFTAPPGYVISIWQMLAALLVGGTVVVIRDVESFPPRKLMHRLSDTGVTVVELVPAVIDWLVDEVARATDRRLSELRWLISTGQELPPALAGRVLTTFPQTRLLNAYGSTECSDDVTHHEVTAADITRERLPIGTPITGARLYVLTDSDAAGGEWRAAAAGEVGELFVGGIVVGLGYVRPEGEADFASYHGTFYRDPIDADSPTGRLYRTGDLVRVNEDGIFYLGRRDRQIKLAGVRVELAAVESALHRHPLVRESAVLMRELAGRPLLVGYYTAHQPIENSELKGMLTSYLPPGTVPHMLIWRPALPLNRNGKIDYQALHKEGIEEMTS